jgi:hypothetical protein
MAIIIFDADLFRTQCPLYANVTTYPDATILNWFDIGSDYISVNDYGYLNGNSRALALNLMAAHLLYLSDKIATGAAMGILTSASEGSVSIGIAPPPFKSMFQAWLAQTPYGQQLYALLSVKGAFCFYTAGSGVTGNIRNPNGTFNNG